MPTLRHCPLDVTDVTVGWEVKKGVLPTLRHCPPDVTDVTVGTEAKKRCRGGFTPKTAGWEVETRWLSDFTPLSAGCNGCNGPSDVLVTDVTVGWEVEKRCLADFTPLSAGCSGWNGRGGGGTKVSCRLSRHCPPDVTDVTVGLRNGRVLVNVGSLALPPSLSQSVSQSVRPSQNSRPHPEKRLGHKTRDPKTRDSIWTPAC